jgi:hypothetical protein
VHRCFTPRTHQNALDEPQIPLEAKTQVPHNLSPCTFYGNYIGPTRARKILRRCFTSRMHRNPLCDPQIKPDAKKEVWRKVPRRNGLFIETTSGPSEHEHFWVDVSRLRCTRMHLVCRRSYRRQKHKFVITCLGEPLMETAPGPLEHEKQCVNVLRPECT